MTLKQAIKILSVNHKSIFLPLEDELNGQLSTGNPFLPFIPVNDGIVIDTDVYDALDQHAIAA
jgi:hypothetical protein